MLAFELPPFAFSYLLALKQVQPAGLTSWLVSFCMGGSRTAPTRTADFPMGAFPTAYSLKPKAFMGG